MPARPTLIHCAAILALAGAADAAVNTGPAAMGDWRADQPGVVRHLTVTDLPAPYATHPTAFPAAVVARPADAALKAPPGFTVGAFAKLEHPRQIRVAPNGDIFVADGHSFDGNNRIVKLGAR